MIRLVLAFVLLALPAWAENIATDSEHLSVRVSFPDALARHPELAQFLRNETNEMIAEMEETARAEAASASSSGVPFRQHTLQIDHDVRVQVGNLTSFLRVVRTYSGGAHPNVFMDPLTWDSSKRDFVKLDAIINDKEGYRALTSISKALRASLMRRPNLWEEDIKLATVPDLTVLQAFTLEPSTLPGRIGGLAFHYSPYEVGPYSEGPQHVLIPQASIARYLDPSVKEFFAGSPAN